MTSSEEAVLPREVVNHPGIDGTWHHYGSLEWWEPERLHGDDYSRPICPVSECASGDNGHPCRYFAERVSTDNGKGAWCCPHHGVFRVFDHPRAEPQQMEQQKLIAGTADSRPEGEQ